EGKQGAVSLRQRQRATLSGCGDRRRSAAVHRTRDGHGEACRAFQRSDESLHPIARIERGRVRERRIEGYDGKGPSREEGLHVEGDDALRRIGGVEDRELHGLPGHLDRIANRDRGGGARVARIRWVSVGAALYLRRLADVALEAALAGGKRSARPGACEKRRRGAARRRYEPERDH